jgi:catechol 2,3-dioxygenase-like lactoylglutathione lyase family enzyme
MKLHEIGLLAKDPKASKNFYHDTLGLNFHHEEDGLSVFDGGWPGVEIGACSG